MAEPEFQDTGFAQQINPLLAGCSVGSVRARAASGFLDRGAQIIYRIIYPAAIRMRINYKMPFSRSTIYKVYHLTGVQRPAPLRREKRA
jgi:hypothetical protein